MLNTFPKGVIFLVSIFFVAFLATASSAQAPIQGGAVGFRVLPNPEHLSPLEWYNRYIPAGNRGTPRELEIDGYQAVEDGRSVYINAANFSGGTVFTNIYVFSYDANDPDGATQEIFNRIKETLNFTNSGQFTTYGQGTCATSQDACSSDFDCDFRNGETCTNNSGDAIRRDVRRVADVTSFNTKLRAFQNTFGSLPQLVSGSFLSGVSFSTWPSWRDTLSSEVGIELFTDPLNKFVCPVSPTIDQETCWDIVSRQFQCPAQGYAYGYVYNPPPPGGGQEAAVFGASFETPQAINSFAQNAGTLSSCSVQFLLATANDVDQDAVPVGIDNCSGIANPTQADSDADGIGDACDVCQFDRHDDADCSLGGVSCDSDLLSWTQSVGACLSPAAPAGSIIPGPTPLSYTLTSPQCSQPDRALGDVINLVNPAPFAGDFDVSINIDSLTIGNFADPTAGNRFSAALQLVINFPNPNQSAGISIYKNANSNLLRFAFSMIFNVTCWLDPADPSCSPGGTSLDYQASTEYTYTFVQGDTLRIRRVGGLLVYSMESTNPVNAQTWTYPQPGNPPLSPGPGTVIVQAGKGGVIPITAPDPPAEGLATSATFTWNAICSNVTPVYPCAPGSGDGICADVDNCPNVANPAQLDINNNGVGDVCEQTCGNGLVDPGEACDPLVSTTAPRCDTIITNAAGSASCNPQSCTWDFSTCVPSQCGNGIIEQGEDCEQGDIEVASCPTALGYNGFHSRSCNPANCLWNAFGTCASTDSCGDGILQSPPEQCDDGNTIDTDACSNTCLINTCVPPAPCATTCGNGVADTGELCGEGGLPLASTCSQLGQPGGATPVACNTPTCSWDLSACTPAVCNNGILEPGEACDPSVQGTSQCDLIGFPAGGTTPVTCSAQTCRWDETACPGPFVSCGVDGDLDGVLLDQLLGEQCDDGNGTSGDGCSASCQIEHCGDGTIQPTLIPRFSDGSPMFTQPDPRLEQCDDGNTDPTDGCDNQCQDNAPPGITGLQAVINGPTSFIIIFNTDEPAHYTIDYGLDPTNLNNSVSDPALNLSHTIWLTGLQSGSTYYFTATVTDAAGNTFTSPVVTTFTTGGAAVCGNNLLETGEQCDDGNTTPGDGCDASCMIEDSAAPLVATFIAAPSGTGTAADIDWIVTDVAPTSGLDRIEIWRAPDVGGVPGTFAEVPALRTTLGGSVSIHNGNTQDTPPAGTYWYGLHAVDVAGNIGTEPVSVQVVVGAGSVCGNSVIETGEQCDDGNTTPGDGCSATCQNEGPPPVVGTLHNNPNNNIFDTYDPLCDGSDPSIIFCDGFEDGVFLAAGFGNGTAADDYWGGHGFWPPAGNDPAGRDYAECNSGTINASRADYGAAGTPCTATTHWANDQLSYAAIGQQGSHALKTIPGNPGQVVSTGPQDISYRFYHRHVGTESTRCPGGYPNCPPFQETGGQSTNGNGWKYVEFMPFNGQGGIHGPLMASWNKADSVFNDRELFGFGDTGCTSPGITNQQSYPTGSPLPYFNHIAARGNWMFTELRIRVVGGSHRLQMWMDDCGADGTGCTGTPTLVADSGLVNAVNTCFGGPGGEGFSTQGLRGVWMNFSNGGTFHGEIQFDEVVVRDRSVLDQDIGFMQPLSPGGGSSSAPPVVASFGVTTGSVIVDWDVTDDNGLERIELWYSKDGGPWTEELSQRVNIPGSATSDQRQIVYNPPPGNYLYGLHAVDTDGNVGTEQSPVAVTVSAAVCGNSSVEFGEQCDDGNTASGDGCSATCQNEVVAAADTEAACAALGANCLCSTPLSHADWTVNGPGMSGTYFYNPSNPAPAMNCVGSQGFSTLWTGDSGGPANFVQIPSTSAELPGTASMPFVTFIPGYAGGKVINFTDAIRSQNSVSPLKRWCTRWYFKWANGTGSHVVSNPTAGCNKKNFEINTGNDGPVWHMNDSSDGTETLFRLPNLVVGGGAKYNETGVVSNGFTNQDCQDHWCEFQLCGSHDDFPNPDWDLSGGRGLFDARVRAVNSSPEKRIDWTDAELANAVVGGLDPGTGMYINLFIANSVDDANCRAALNQPGGGRLYSHGMVAGWNTDTNQWIPPACEMEGGCGGSAAAQSNLAVLGITSELQGGASLTQKLVNDLVVRLFLSLSLVLLMFTIFLETRPYIKRLPVEAKK